MSNLKNKKATRQEYIMQMLELGDTIIDKILLLLLEVDVESTAAHNHCIAEISKLAVKGGLKPEMAYKFAETLVEWELETNDMEI
jgi:hypothetical protein